jgi:hypothetical protein
VREESSAQETETRIPDDFCFGPEVRMWARQAGMPDLFVDHEEIRFIEKWQRLGGRRVDWQGVAKQHLEVKRSEYGQVAGEETGT